MALLPPAIRAWAHGHGLPAATAIEIPARSERSGLELSLGSVL